MMPGANLASLDAPGYHRPSKPRSTCVAFLVLARPPERLEKSQGHFSGAAVLHRGPSPAVPVDSYTYYCTYGPMVLRRCRKLLGDEQTARDAMHDVFVQVLSRADELTDQAPSSLLSCNGPIVVACCPAMSRA